MYDMYPVSNMFVLKNYPLHIDTIQYFKELLVKMSAKLDISVPGVFFIFKLAKSTDPNKMFGKYPFTGIQNEEFNDTLN